MANPYGTKKQGGLTSNPKRSKVFDRVHGEISAIYEEFRRFWKSKECLLTRRYLKELGLRDDQNLLHPLGEFVILYTPVRFRPPLMLIGNNPSWFHRTDSILALANLRQVAGKIPSVNVYTQHDKAYVRALNQAFTAAERLDLLNECVGLNRFWIQTGSDGLGEIAQGDRQNEFRTIRAKCEEGTRKIIELIQPKAVALFGIPAQRAVPYRFRQSLNQIIFQNCPHPCARRGNQELVAAIKALIKHARI